MIYYYCFVLTWLFPLSLYDSGELYGILVVFPPSAFSLERPVQSVPLPSV